MTRRTPVFIKGVYYPSISEAARAHGVTPQAVHCALDRGTQDQIGERKRSAKRWKGVKK